MSTTANNHILFSLSSIRARQCRPLEELSIRRLPALCLLYVWVGNGRIWINGRVRKVEAPQLLLIPAGATIHALCGDSATQYYQVLIRGVAVNFHAHGSRTEPISHLPGLSDNQTIALSGSPFWQEQFTLLYDSGHHGGDAAHRFVRDCRLQQMLSQLLPDKPTPHIADHPDGIQLSIAYMEEHYTHKLTRDLLANIAMLSPGAYCRSFKRTTGMTPTEYLHQLRIRKAQDLLAQGNSLKKTAAEVSYSNEFHFSRVFKKVTGIPPTLYIKRHVLRLAIATRFDWRDNLAAIGYRPALAVDCYHHPGTDPFEYDRRLVLRLGELRDAKPDLIVADFSHEPFYDTFKKIAPTVILEHSFDWRHTHRQLAELVGRSAEAEHSIMESLQVAADTASRLGTLATDRCVIMLQVMYDHLIVQGTIRHPLNELMYNELGLQPDHAVPRHNLRVQVSAQDMPPLMADHVWVRHYSDHPDVMRVYQTLQARDFWMQMPAYRSQRIHLTGNWLLQSWTPQGRKRIMQDIERDLT